MSKPITIKELRALIADLPDDGIVVLDNSSEERVLLQGEYRVSYNSGTSDGTVCSDEQVEGGLTRPFSAILHLTSWS